MALALNNLQRVDMPLNKETETESYNKETLFIVYLYVQNEIINSNYNTVSMRERINSWNLYYNRL